MTGSGSGRDQMTCDDVLFESGKNVDFSDVDMWSKDRLFDVMELLYKAERSCKTNHIPTNEYVTYTILTLLSAASKLK